MLEFRSASRQCWSAVQPGESLSVPPVTVDEYREVNTVDEYRTVNVVNEVNEYLTVTFGQGTPDTLTSVAYPNPPCGTGILPVVTRHIYAGLETIEEYVYCDDGQGGDEWVLAREFIWGDRFPEPLAMIDHTGEGTTAGSSPWVYHYLRDALGSVVALTDSDGDVVERYDYDPYGQTYIQDPTTGNRRTASAFGNPFAWTAQRYDAGVSLYDFPFRTYSTRLGRWLQRDPLGYVDGVSLYQYVGSMPTFFTDPLGLFPIGTPIDLPGLGGSGGNGGNDDGGGDPLCPGNSADDGPGGFPAPPIPPADDPVVEPEDEEEEVDEQDDEADDDDLETGIVDFSNPNRVLEGIIVVIPSLGKKHINKGTNKATIIIETSDDESVRVQVKDVAGLVEAVRTASNGKATVTHLTITDHGSEDGGAAMVGSNDALNSQNSKALAPYMDPNGKVTLNACYVAKYPDGPEYMQGIANSTNSTTEGWTGKSKYIPNPGYGKVVIFHTGDKVTVEPEVP